MPQIVIPIIAQAGLSTFATLGIAVASIAATAFVTSLFAPKAPKPDASERTIKVPTPPRIWILGKRRSFGAQMLFVNTSESETVDVWAFCEGPVHAVTKVYLNDDPVTVTNGVVQKLSDGSYDDGRVLVGWNLGALIETAHAPVVERVTDWTANHRGDGIVSGYMIKRGVKSKNFLDVYPQGDNVSMSLAIEGRACHDPRNPASDPADPSTWAYTENAALHLLWYFMAYRGFDYGEKIAPRIQMWIDAANDCDTPVPLKAGGFEPKYRSAVMFTADNEPKDIEAQIRQNFDGWTGRDEDGCVVVHSGVVYTPTVSIGPDDIVDWELQDFVEAENTLNEIIVRHISEAHDFNMVEPTPWRDDADIALRGEVSTTNDYQVPSHTQARRLAKRMMARANAFQRGTIKLVFSARAAMAERYINLRIAEAGEVFFDGVVEIIGGERDYETGGVVLEYVSVDGNFDAWNPATEDGEPAPLTTKAYVSPTETPTITTATAELDATGTGARVRIIVEGYDRDDITWFARWRSTTDAAWNEQEYTDIDPGAAALLVTSVVPTEIAVDVAVAYSTGDGRTSEWSPTVTVSTSTAGLAPGPNTAFTATGGVGEATGSWSNSASSNFGHSELWAGPTTNFADASQLGADYTGPRNTTEAFTQSLAAGTHYLWTVAFNAAGTASSRTGPVEVTVT
ncbi:hypothetical protein [Novosphingobium sp. HII-3]|uniref:hypothetical protein n=1 Tax=Novosphingobium sp. HII-3 TaxID=2075565 RepID=UPI0011AF1A98|nr:hypothetical protein [Novosphingobium sp. HII-3]